MDRFSLTHAKNNLICAATKKTTMEKFSEKCHKWFLIEFLYFPTCKFEMLININQGTLHLKCYVGYNLTSIVSKISDKTAKNGESANIWSKFEVTCTIRVSIKSHHPNKKDTRESVLISDKIS